MKLTLGKAFLTVGGLIIIVISTVVMIGIKYAFEPLDMNGFNNLAAIGVATVFYFSAMFSYIHEANKKRGN